MDADSADRTFLLIVFTVTAALLLLIVGGGMAADTMKGGGMLGGGSAGASGWMWIPNLLLAVLGTAIFAVLFGKNRGKRA